MEFGEVVVMVVRCCICGKERVKNEWLEPLELEADDEEEEVRRVAISHSYCPECLESVRAELNLLAAG